MLPSRDIARLLDIMAQLRTPGHGCPWDLAQDAASLIPFAIEEAYEVADAVERHDTADLRDELGDLLLQVVFQARLAEEAGTFDFGGVVEAITAKLIRRHPHVFGDRRDLTPEQVKRLWGEIKAAERAGRAARGGGPDARRGLLADVPGSLPPVLRAAKLQERAATVGFDWPDAVTVLAKVREEVDEVAEALAMGDRHAAREEIGDLLFAVTNLARHAGTDVETVLRGANAKFERRFGAIEHALERDGVPLANAGLARMEQLWTDAKQAEAAAPDR